MNQKLDRQCKIQINGLKSDEQIQCRCTLATIQISLDGDKKVMVQKAKDILTDQKYIQQIKNWINI